VCVCVCMCMVFCKRVLHLGGGLSLAHEDYYTQLLHTCTYMYMYSNIDRSATQIHYIRVVQLWISQLWSCIFALHIGDDDICVHTYTLMTYVYIHIHWWHMCTYIYMCLTIDRHATQILYFRVVYLWISRIECFLFSLHIQDHYICVHTCIFIWLQTAYICVHI